MSQRPGRPRTNRSATKGAAVKRASVLECSSPLELWPQHRLANQRVNVFFTVCDYLRTSHGSRKNAARANEPWLLGLASQTVFQAVEGHRTP
jgi:hypothetical protein